MTRSKGKSLLSPAFKGNSLDLLLSPAFLDELQAFLREFGITGCAIVLLRDTADRWEKKALTHGSRDGVEGHDVTPQTLFPLGQDPLLISLTLLRLLGARGLDEKATLGEVLALDDGHQGDLGRLKDLTVEQVLSHQTGLPGLDTSLLDPEAGIEGLAKLTPTEAGQPKHRSALDMLIAIKLVEHLSSTDWVSAVHTHLLAPMEIERPNANAGNRDRGVWRGFGSKAQNKAPQAVPYPTDAAPVAAPADGGGIWLNSMDMVKLLKHLPLIKEYHTASQPLVAAPTVPLLWPDAHFPVTAGLGIVQSTHRNQRIWQHAAPAAELANSYGCSALVGRFPNHGLGWAVMTNSPEGGYLAAFVKFRLLERAAGVPSSGWDKLLQHERKKELVRTAFGSHHNVVYGRRGQFGIGINTGPPSRAGSQSASSDLSTTATCGSPPPPQTPQVLPADGDRAPEILGTWGAPGLKPWAITPADVLPPSAKPEYSILPPWATRTGARCYAPMPVPGWWRCWTVLAPDDPAEETRYGIPVAVTVQGDEMRVKGLTHDDPNWELVLRRQT